MFWVGTRIHGIKFRCSLQKAFPESCGKGSWESSTCTQSLRSGQTRCGVCEAEESPSELREPDITGKRQGEHVLEKEVQGVNPDGLLTHMLHKMKLNRMEHQVSVRHRGIP